MKILFLSCSTGEGHNSAARAIMEAAARRAIDCELADPVAFGSEKATKVVAVCYNGMIRRVPQLFGAVYKVGDLFERTGIPSPVYFANALYAKALGDYIVKGGFDAVICTHLYGMEAMTAVRRQPGGAVPCYGVLTDYTCIPFFAETALDGYFIPHEDLRQELEGKGIPPQRICATGIPVGERFSNRIGRKAARNYLMIPEDRRVYLVMSGGIGVSGLGELCDALSRAESGAYTAYVLTGRNSDMQETLQKRYGGDRHIQVITFTEKVNMYMEAANVLLSKPGGLSSTEAAVSGIPMVHVMTIPGCETKNAEFFASRGMSVNASNVEEAVAQAMALAKGSEAAGRMVRSQRRWILPGAADRILDWVTGHA